MSSHHLNIEIYISIYMKKGLYFKKGQLLLYTRRSTTSGTTINEFCDVQTYRQTIQATFSKKKIQTAYVKVTQP